MTGRRMKIRIKEGAFCAEGMDNSYEFIKDCYDSFLETSKLLFFTKKVGSVNFLV